jgi:alkylhydroperoxidase family enzyme
MTTSSELQPEAGWAGARRVRMQPPAPAERGLLFRSMSRLSRLFGRDDVPDILAVININPRLFWTWLLFASRLMPFGRLQAQEREKIILRTGWNCHSRYEWGQHVEIGLGAGLSDADILRVAHGPAACADRYERALLQACDEIHHDKCIAPATWALLAEKYDESLLIEIMILIGHYEMIAGFLNSTGIVLEPALEQCLAGFNERVRGLVAG